MNFNARFTDLIRASHIQPIQGLEGGLNFQSMLCDRKLVIRFWSIPFSVSFSFRSAPMKFVQLSLIKRLTCPRRAVNRLSDNMKELVDKSFDISKCTARVVIHVKMTPYLFPFAAFELVAFDNLT